MACDPARITGSCAECQRTKLAGSDFVLGDLEDFLAAERGVHAAQFTDVRAGARATGATEVCGPTLRCRDCVVASRDAADAARGTAWRAEAASITFTALPLGLKPHAAFPAAYVVEAASAGKPAAALGVAAGWRVRNVGGRDCRGSGGASGGGGARGAHASAAARSRAAGAEAAAQRARPQLGDPRVGSAASHAAARRLRGKAHAADHAVRAPPEEAREWAALRPLDTVRGNDEVLPRGAAARLPLAHHHWARLRSGKLFTVHRCLRYPPFPC